MSVKVKIPATSANMGPCFDCAGISLALYNYMEITPIDSKDIIVVIEEDNNKRIFNVDNKNIIYQAVEKYYKKIGKDVEGYEFKTETYIPIARGLGSSASVIAGALVGINEIKGNLLTKEELINIAANIEGHPDNTTPAFTGGFVLASIEDDGSVLYDKIDWNEDWKIVLLIPDYKLLTELSRSVLPEKINFKDAVFNIKKSAQLAFAILNKNEKMMKSALNDKIHQPYRAKLIPGMEEIINSLKKENNILGCVLSGAGPSLLVITKDEKIENIKDIVKNVWYDLDIKYNINLIDVDKKGLEILHKYKRGQNGKVIE